MGAMEDLAALGYVDTTPLCNDCDLNLIDNRLHRLHGLHDLEKHCTKCGKQMDVYWYMVRDFPPGFFSR